MEQLQSAILGFMLEESRRDPYSTISPQVISNKYGIDPEIVGYHVEFLTAQGMAKQETNGFGLPRQIIFDIRLKNNDPRSPKGSDFFYINQEKLKELIEKVKKS